MTDPVLEVDGLQRSYAGPPEVLALREATFSVGVGESVAVTGPSGSGKSTLLNQIGLLDTPTDGSYRLDGVETSRLRERHRTRLRARTIGFVFQASHLIGHLSAVANVEVPLRHLAVPRRERVARAEEAMEAVGLSHRLHAKPGTLSGGEMQRTAIARAIATRPRVLLCDEPTGNLDSENTEASLSVLLGLAVDHTVLIVTHEQDVAARCGRVITVRDGVTHG